MSRKLGRIKGKKGRMKWRDGERLGVVALQVSREGAEGRNGNEGRFGRIGVEGGQGIV